MRWFWALVVLFAVALAGSFWWRRKVAEDEAFIRELRALWVGEEVPIPPAVFAGQGRFDHFWPPNVGFSDLRD